MADKTIRGRFVWHELMTADSAAAHAFYNKVLGWTSQPWEHDPSYSMFAAASGPLGGTVAQSGAESGWVHYIGTPDIEATVQQAKGLGASIVKEITSIGGGGSYAILTDPQGAKFAVYTSTAELGREKPAKRGEFSWHELATTDTEAALRFYGALFGWEKVGEHDMGPMGFYYLLGRNGNPLIGVYQPTDIPGSPAWLGYVRVKDVNKIVKKVKSAGGTLVHGPMEVPGGDWIVQFADPQGAMFAVHAVKADLEPAVAKEPAAATPAPAAAPVEVKAAVARRSAPAKQRPAKKEPAKKQPAKKKVKKKAVAKKKPAAKQRRAAAKSVKRPARKATRKATKAGKAPKKKQKRTAAKAKSSRKAGGKARKGK